ncbi:Carboxylesterase, type B [Kalmanozyma brasiliensis GHG001]|uniref:Diphthamide biosynthesis protein 4 n=1 Tax=Kalmanozyma brasiliensis (strain GHG001) TaxID=1365824 RepID=V5ESY6_KALBG|nr:Carboxylesterase, type B [Kalmanozyma brasiliensis GHG001]EST06098.1 Carboxylesterase, type B [Kalmanozyma brasiliensis GHG001]
MGQSSSTFVEHASASVDIPSHGTLVGRVAKDNVTGELKSQRFAGIPYAQPPVGPLRWRRPQPLPPSHRYDDKQYDRFACACPQPTNYALTNGITLPSSPVPQSEDCLYLNIWCPVTATGERMTGKLPVLFFIHGGWLQIGNAHLSPDGDPSDLLHVAGLQAIVVTTAYRLNAFGFLAHDALRYEDPDGLTGNYGFLDQRAALEWVHANIAHFGGDPENITVSGLSAGAHSTHSQLMHELDLSTRHPGYKPIIRRVFLQSNAAVWPSKSVEETQGQLDELCTQLDVPLSLTDADKIDRLRKVDALELAKVLARMEMHTFRATRDMQEGAFVRPDWTKAMMDGRLAKYCQEHGVSFVIGECDDEAWVYRYINTPTDHKGLVRQLNNYYTLPLVEKMLPHYGVPATSRRVEGRVDAAKDDSLYAVLGVKPSSTTAEIRAAYLAQVRLHHPDKLQQLGDPTAIADSPASSDRIRQLNHAYKVLTDHQARSNYDDLLAAQRAASNSIQPRISAVIDFESFTPTESSPLTFSYVCRCGSSYTLSEDQVQDRVDVVPCDGCSENIRVRYDDGETSRSNGEGMTPEEVGDVFGRICADSQVYIAERMLITDLLNGGLPSDRILRYRINYRARAIDAALKGYGGVSHSFDDFVWWFSCLQSGEEQERVKAWLGPWMAWIRGEEVGKEWYEGKKADGRLLRVLGKDGQISVERDERWEEKEELIEAMVRVRREMVDEYL